MPGTKHTVGKGECRVMAALTSSNKGFDAAEDHDFVLLCTRRTRDRRSRPYDAVRTRGARSDGWATWHSRTWTRQQVSAPSAFSVRRRSDAAPVTAASLHLDRCAVGYANVALCRVALALRARGNSTRARALQCAPENLPQEGGHLAALGSRLLREPAPFRGQPASLWETHEWAELAFLPFLAAGVGCLRVGGIMARWSIWLEWVLWDPKWPYRHQTPSRSQKTVWVFGHRAKNTSNWLRGSRSGLVPKRAQNGQNTQSHFWDPKRLGLGRAKQPYRPYNVASAGPRPKRAIPGISKYPNDQRLIDRREIDHLNDG